VVRRPQNRLISAEKNGLTLLEVLLSLALTTVIMVIIGTAINLHLRVITIDRSHVEEAQLARALLDQIAKDLRSTLYFPDEGGGSASMDTAGDTGDLTGNGLSGGSTSADDESGDLSDLMPSIPGILGDLYQIQIDVGVLPKPEQYIAQLSAGGGRLIDRPSEMKTVAYYVQYTDDGAEADVTGTSTGLVRRSLDRAITEWAIENGNAQSLEMSGKVIASEVVAVRFRYFSGYDWVEQWDSSIDGGIPSAVEIMLEIARSDSDPDAEVVSGLLAGEVNSENTFTYRRVVYIPTSNPQALMSDLDADLSDSTGGSSL